MFSFANNEDFYYYYYTPRIDSSSGRGSARVCPPPPSRCHSSALIGLVSKHRYVFTPASIMTHACIFLTAFFFYFYIYQS